MPKKFQYRLVTTTFSDPKWVAANNEARLIVEGEQGWELVSVTFVHDTCTMYLKRELENEQSYTPLSDILRDAKAPFETKQEVTDES